MTTGRSETGARLTVYRGDPANQRRMTAMSPDGPATRGDLIASPTRREQQKRRALGEASNFRKLQRRPRTFRTDWAKLAPTIQGSRVDTIVQWRRLRAGRFIGPSLDAAAEKP